MPYLRNPFPIIKNYTDLRKYESQINQVLEKFFREFFGKFEILSLKRVLDTFWALVDEKKTFNPLGWYDTFSVFILRLCSTQILLDEGRILQESHDIFIGWFLYLSNRIIPNQNHLSSDFLTKLYTNAIIPVPDIKAANSLMLENADLAEKYNYFEVLTDKNIPIVERLRIFQAYFIAFYEYFKRKCVYIEKQIYSWEDRPYPLTSIRDIFQLYNNNDRTPPDYPREALKVLIHVRNSCAHKNMIVLENGSIRIRDYNNKNEFTYDVIKNIAQLNDYYHVLIVLDKGFDALALAIMLKRRIENLYMSYGKIIQCPDCSEIDYYCILPTITLIICKQCKFPFKPI
ncbi:MAG: hypothetical protein HWN80_18620 [Candidatus Lokiarchaeota archaeon]|nr:hypothetical protein [Candidatus Lokiarchaeota archaeon]